MSGCEEKFSVVAFNLLNLELKSGNAGHQTFWFIGSWEQTDKDIFCEQQRQRWVSHEINCIYCVFMSSFFCCFCFYSQFMDDNDDEENQKFLSNGLLKKKKYEEYHEEYVRGAQNHCCPCLSVIANYLICFTVLQIGTLILTTKLN